MINSGDLLPSKYVLVLFSVGPSMAISTPMDADLVANTIDASRAPPAEISVARLDGSEPVVADDSGAAAAASPGSGKRARKPVQKDKLDEIATKPKPCANCSLSISPSPCNNK